MQSPLVTQADQAAAAGDLEAARRLLEEACDGRAEPDLYLRLAGIQRALGRLQPSLESIHKALAKDPRDFTALLMRASVLDQLQSPEAPEAWSHALAQKPTTPLPPPLQAAVAKAEQRVAEWAAQREAVLADAMAPAMGRATTEEQERLDRFRSNAVRRTRVFHSEPTQFHFPGLVEREFHPRRLFPWIDMLDASTEAIAAELEAVLKSERAELVPYIEYPDHLPLDQWRALNRNRDWTAIHLLQNGERVDTNAAHCPTTMEVLARIDQPVVSGSSPNAMFSLLAPNTAIPPHVGVNNARLVCHLPLIVPKGCWFRVGAETRMWERGRAFVFDDTIEHEALNPTDELRVVLIFDVWNPELSAVERDGIAALIGSENSGFAGGL